MNSTTTQYLSKDEVSAKLQTINYSFQESYWDAFQETQSTSRFTSPKAPAVKLSPKLLAIPISLVLISTIIYFSITNLKSQNTPTDSLNHKQEATKLPEAPKAIRTPVSKPAEVKELPANPVSSIPSPSAANSTEVSIAKKEVSTAPAIALSPVSAKIKKEESTNNSTQTAKVIKPEPVAAKVQSPQQEQKTDNNTGVRKKKKRRNEKSDETILIASPEDDNVVVPEI